MINGTTATNVASAATRLLKAIEGPEWVVGLSDKKKEAFIDKKIFWSVGLVVNEVLWHLLFFRNAHDDNYFDYVSFKRSDELVLIQ